MTTHKKNVFFFLLIFVCAALLLFALPQNDTYAQASDDYPQYNSEDDVYEIATADQLLGLAEWVNTNAEIGGQLCSTLSYRLTADIDLSGIDWTPIGSGDSYQYYYNVTDVFSEMYNDETPNGDNERPAFASVWGSLYSSLFMDDQGNSAATSVYDTTAQYYYRYQLKNAFRGTFDGGRYTVSNLTYAPTSEITYGGLFGCVANATIKNVILEDEIITLSSTDENYVGGIVGCLYDSVVTGCGNISGELTGYGYVGGIVGKAVANSTSGNFIDDAAYAKLGTPKTVNVSSCFTISGTLDSHGYTAGIVGFGDGLFNISRCLNSGVIHSAASRMIDDNVVYQGAGIIGGANESSSSISIVSSLGLVSGYDNNNHLVFGALTPYSGVIGTTQSYYIVFDGEDPRLSVNATFQPDTTANPCDLTSILMDDNVLYTLGNSYWRAGGNLSGTTYYYPTPLSCPDNVKITFTAYKVIFNDTIQGYYVPNTIYTYPGTSVQLNKTGYTLSGWEGNGTGYDFGDTQILSADLTVTPVWQLNAPSLTNVNNYYQYEYTAANRTITPSFLHPVKNDLTATYTWQKEGESSFTANALTVKDVSDGGTYSCYVTVRDSMDRTAFSQSVLFTVNISPKPVTVSVTLTGAVGDTNNSQLKSLTHVYDGQPVPLPGYVQDGLCAGHELSVDYSYHNALITIERSATANVGSFRVSASATVSENNIDISDNYTLTYVDYNYTVVNATITYSLDSLLYSQNTLTVTYDGNPHTLLAEHFSQINTAGNEEYVLSIEDTSYTDVTNGDFSHVSFTISADNHDTLYGEIVVVITPMEVTVTPLSSRHYNKPYDGTASFDVNSITSDAYTLSYQGASAYLTVVSALYSQADVGDGLTITVTLSVSGNYTLANNTIEYTQCRILKKVVSITPDQTFSFSKTFDGTVAVSGDLPTILEGRYVLSDNVGVTPTSAVYNDSGVLTAQSVSVTFELDAAYRSNYTFVQNDSVNTTAVSFIGYITPVRIFVTPNDGVFFTKTYDRTTAFDISLLTTPSLKFSFKDENGDVIVFKNFAPKMENNVVVPNYYLCTFDNDDTVTIGLTSAAYNVATIAADSVIVSLSINSSDYSLGALQMTYPASIEKKSVSIVGSSLIATDRYYDGTTEVELTGGQLSGVISGDTVTLILSGGTIASASASVTPYQVTVNTITLSNENYLLSNPTPGGVTVNILFIPSIVHPQIETDTIFLGEDLPEITLSLGDTPGAIYWETETPTQSGAQEFRWYFIPENENYTEPDGYIQITVQARVLNGLTISCLPTKTAYTALDKFDTAGMVVVASYNSGENVTLQEYDSYYDGYYIRYQQQEDVLHYGDNKVTIVYYAYEQDVSLTVSKIAFVKPTLGASTRTYTGFDLSPAPMNIVSGQMTVTGDLSARDKGHYSLSVSLVNNAYNDYAWDDGTSETLDYSWEILAAGRYPLTLSDSSFVYSGQSNQVAIRNDSNVDNGFYTYSGTTSATNVGTYEIVVTLKSDNYYWIDEQENLTWAITPYLVAQPVLFSAPYVYNMLSQTVSYSTSDYYSVTGDTTFTNAGNYALTFTLNNVYEDDILYANYVWEGTNSDQPFVLNYSVEKLRVAIPTTTVQRVVYNGAQYSIKISPTVYYNVTGRPTATDVGTYTASVNLLDNANTVWEDGTIDNIEIVWSILPFTVSEPTVSKQNYYTGYEQIAGITISDYYYITGESSAKEVGEYTVFINLSNANYCWEGGSKSQKTLVWSILRSQVPVPDAPENLLYNGFEQTAYIVTNNAYTIAGNTGTAKGEYTATVTLKDTTGYEWADGTTAPKTYTWGIYSLNIVSDGEIISLSDSYELGTSLSPLIKTGYTFVGWYTSPDFSESSKVTSIDELTGDVSVYAKWEKTADTSTSIGGQETPTTQSSGTLSKSSRDKIIAGAIILGACLILSFIIIVLGGRKRR